jgi:citrate lyase beta subunit
VSGVPRPRRVLLFCPATDRRKIEKAARSGADGVILDLEDAIPPACKTEARGAAVRALQEIDFGERERLVRVNPAGSGLLDADLRTLALCSRPPDAWVLPKVETAADIRRSARRLATLERRRRRVPPGALLALIESARGVAALPAIARPHPRLQALLFGAEDLVGDLGGVRSREGREVLCARSAVAIHAAAAGLQAIDTPHVTLGDPAGLLADTREALALGYAGKLAIHPEQIEPILSVFTPTRAEIEAALRLVREHRRHGERGAGVFVLDGRMVDRPMLRAAENLLVRARRAGVLPDAPGAPPRTDAR